MELFGHMPEAHLLFDHRQAGHLSSLSLSLFLSPVHLLLFGGALSHTSTKGTVKPGLFLVSPFFFLSHFLLFFSASLAHFTLRARHDTLTHTKFYTQCESAHSVSTRLSVFSVTWRKLSSQWTPCSEVSMRTLSSPLDYRFSQMLINWERKRNIFSLEEQNNKYKNSFFYPLRHS